MNKRCQCGQEMDVTLRTIVYARKLMIMHVPVYTCLSCEHSELVSEIKQDVIDIMQQMNEHAPSKRVKVMFDEQQELASVYKECLEHEGGDLSISFEKIAQERVNQLLDVYLLAQTWGDMTWMEDVERRLRQVSCFRTNQNRVKIG
ncbi:hypothetical protein [Paenibacillus marinisediminis]